MIPGKIPAKTLILFSSLALLGSAPHAAADGWPQWRGAAQNGVAPAGDYPLRWNDQQGVAWQMEVPGKGSSTPVIADEIAFLTSGIDGKNMLLAIDTASGKLKWQADLGADRGNKHIKGGGSNPSPLVDGELVFAYFRSGDLACVDRSGKIRWQTNLQEQYGEDTLWWDLGSSPLLTETAVVVAVMQTGPSYLVAFDKTSGDLLWKQDRNLDAPEEAAQSYSTPLHVTIDGKDAIAVLGADHLTLHDAGDGRLLGKLGGFNPTDHKYFRSIASPVASGNLIVCPYARGETITAVRMDALAAGQGEQAIAWLRDDLGSDVPTPALHEGRVYVVSDGKQSKGTVSCLDLQTGQTLWSVALPKSRIGFSSSPLVAGDHLYVTGEDATTHVIGPLGSDQPKLLASNSLSDDDPFTVASPVPLDDSLLLRSRNQLHRIVGQ